jgi:chorismate--pyruvate lyase
MSLQWQHWQRAPGSLSLRLAALGDRLEVQRLSQSVQPLLPGEARDLHLPASTRALVREVVLRVDGQALVWARSVVPAHATRGPWRALRGLGTRPLAELLFADPAVSRSPLRPEVWRRSSPWYCHASTAWLAGSGQTWPGNHVVARSSVFWRQGMPLRVFEAFAALPRSTGRADSQRVPWALAPGGVTRQA